MSFRTVIAIVLAAGLATPASARAQATAASPQPVTAGWHDGFFVQSANGDYRLLLGALVQFDGRFSVDDPPPFTDTFTVRRVRPTLSGRVAKYFDFRLMPDFGSGATVLLDAYFDIRFSPAFRVRTGKDKTPIGYELLQPDLYLLFPERALASGLVPNRDIGVQAQGDLAGGRVFYAAGLFNGVPDGGNTTTDVDTNHAKDVAARIVVQPFGRTSAPGAMSGFGFQVGGSMGRQGGPLPVFRTSAGQAWFAYAPAASAGGDRARVSPAVFYYYKAFGGFAEYMRSTQSVASTRTSMDATNRAWNVSASYILTGEAASYGGVQPAKGFDPANGHWGALQIAARYTTLDVDPDVFAMALASATAGRSAKSFTIAANWYPAAFIKYYATFERTTFHGGDPRPPEDVILLRAQVGF